MKTYEQQVEEVRKVVVASLQPYEHLEPAAIIHGLTLALAQAIVMLRGPDVNSASEALAPIVQGLHELVEEWWIMGSETGGMPN